MLAIGNFDRESLRKNVFAGRWFLQMISEASGMNYHWLDIYGGCPVKTHIPMFLAKLSAKQSSPMPLMNKDNQTLPKTQQAQELSTISY